MRLAPAIALAALCISAPAFATGGIRCAPVQGSGPVLDLVIGHAVGPTVVGAMLRDGRRTLATGGVVGRSDGLPMTVGQSWIDDRELKLDLLDAQARRYEGKLRTHFRPKLRGQPAIGTFTRNGRTFRVRCVAA